jgi:prepilin-type N-terminal cleavage/methylation domain-containing protein
MASPRTSTDKGTRGFTLIEVLVVMSLMVIVAGFGLIVSMESYRGDSFRTERDTLVATLQQARTQALDNMCFGASCAGGKPHGVHLSLHQYVVFQGDSYATRDAALDTVTDAQYFGLATTSPSLTDIVFSQLAGTTTPNPIGVTTISLVDTTGQHTSVITINPEGQISWTN